MRRWEKEIKRSIVTTENLGWKIVEGAWIDDVRECCCALGACIIAKGDYNDFTDPYACIKEYFNATKDEVTAFIAGFDGENYPAEIFDNPEIDYTDTYNFGKEMRSFALS